MMNELGTSETSEPTRSQAFRIVVSPSIYVSDITLTDKPAYLEYLQEKQIYDQTLAIPFPYTEADADWWMGHVAETTKKYGCSTLWAIRRADGKLMGAIGLHDFEPGKSHRAEIGYWLAKPYWNQGIMSEVVKAVTSYSIREFGLIRIWAPIFSFNVGSARVLEKAGYEFEGVLRKNYKKDGKIFDGKLYAKTVET